MMPPERSFAETERPAPAAARLTRARLLDQALGLLSCRGAIRPRTLILLRWVALAGQASAVLGAWLLGARFALLPVLVVLFVAALVNLVMWHAPAGRASERETVAQLGFDMLHAGLLLTFTGGIANPFALFVLVPLTIGATTLPLRPLLQFSAATAATVLVMAVFPAPLDFAANPPLPPHVAMRIGHLLALAIGGAFVAAYVHRVSVELGATEDALAATQMGLAREQRLQHLGGVVAAAAHEMGTPLATIKLVASELADELSDRPEIAEDLALMRASVERCREILRGMGAAGKDDLLLHAAPLGDVLAEAAAPHRDRGIVIELSPSPGMEAIVRRDPALIHALRNLVQNAVDFAHERVTVTATRDAGRIVVSICDDGPGYPPALLGRLGEPFLTTRRVAPTPGAYEGMGLGLFIARTLLERSGGTVSFLNRAGAVARVTWPEAALLADDRERLGQNPAITG